MNKKGSKMINLHWTHSSSWWPELLTGPGCQKAPLVSRQGEQRTLQDSPYDRRRSTTSAMKRKRLPFIETPLYEEGSPWWRTSFGQTASCSFNITFYNDSCKFHIFLFLLLKFVFLNTCIFRVYNEPWKSLLWVQWVPLKSFKKKQETEEDDTSALHTPSWGQGGGSSWWQGEERALQEEEETDWLVMIRKGKRPTRLPLWQEKKHDLCYALHCRRHECFKHSGRDERKT